MYKTRDSPLLLLPLAYKRVGARRGRFSFNLHAWWDRRPTVLRLGSLARDPLGLGRRGRARAPLRLSDRSSAADPPEVPIWCAGRGVAGLGRPRAYQIGHPRADPSIPIAIGCIGGGVLRLPAPQGGSRRDWPGEPQPHTPVGVRARPGPLPLPVLPMAGTGVGRV